MDRRQRKTREAIFQSFISLLSHKNYSSISVQDIIDSADIGRTTFYAHFETKDYLLKELCDELFCHIFDSSEGNERAHTHIFECEAPDSVFLHLLRHLQENDYNIIQLLSSQNNEIFLQYFKSNLQNLIQIQFDKKIIAQKSNLPENYLIHHISSSFVNTVSWWISQGMKESPELITEYFLKTIQSLV